MLFSAFISAQISDLEFQGIVSDDIAPDEGQTIELTFEIKNLGPNAASNVIVTNLIPAGFTHVSDDSSGQYIVGTNTWAILAINSGATSQMKITVTVDAGTNGTTISVNPIISGSDQTDPNMTNNSVSLDHNVNYPDLEVTKTVDILAPQVGETIEYTITVTHLNTTTLEATNVLIEDILSTSLTYVSDDSGGAYNSVTGIWNIGTLIAGQQEQIKISVTINVGASGVNVNNLARILSFDQTDLNTGNNQSNIEVLVTTADLIMTKTVDNNSPNEGQNIVYTLEVENNSSSLSDASNIIVTDLLPATLAYVSDDGGGDYNNVTGIWTLPSTLTPGDKIELKITATVDPNPSPHTIINTAEITSFDQDDDNQSDNSSTVSIIVNGIDLAITKTVSDNNPAVSDIITYTIVVTNQGSLPANDITVEDALSNRLTFISSTETQGTAYNSGTDEWFVNDLNAGASATLTIDVQVKNSANRRLIPNTASILSVLEPDSILFNNSDTVDIAVGSADLEIIKTVNVPTQLEAGTVIFTIEAKNNSADTDTFITFITDIFPNDVTYVSDDSGGAYDPVTGIWDAGNVANGSSNFLNITCTVNNGTKGFTITNTASGTAIMSDPDTSNNSDDASFQVNGADLAVNKTVDNEFPIELDALIYTITVTNNGPDDATNVQILDQLPFSVNYVGDIASQGTYNNISGIWDIGTITNGSTLTLTINTQVRLGGAFTNTASIFATDQGDDSTANNSNSAKVSAKKAFDAGSAIIDMGVATQTINNGLVPFGLIYDLSINNKVPIYWVVNHAKSWVSPTAKQDQVDINIAGKDYKGGPFVIPAEFMVIAQPIIDTWVSNYPGLTVDINLPAFDAPIYDYITSFPRAVLDTQNGDKLQDAFYDKSGVPASFGRLGTPDDLNNCDDMYTMPHADPQDWDASTVNNLISFIEQGGYFWAACHAVSAMEGAVDIDNDGNPDLNLLSNNGLVLWDDHDDGTPPYSYNTQIGIFNGAETAGDPLMQFIGTMDGSLQNGSEQIYIPEIEGWRDSTILALTDDDHPEVINGDYPTGPAVALAYGRAFGNNNYGMVMYEASHRIQGGTEAEDVAAARAYGNFLLQAGIERRPKIKMGTLPGLVLIDNNFSIVPEVSGIAPPFTYEWTDTCGGTFSDPTALDPTYTPNPAFVERYTCLISFVVTDSCGRRNFTSFAVAVDKDTDSDGIIDSNDIDDDNDGILDIVEENGNTTRDSDGDGVLDRSDLDADGDGILDIVEGGLTPAQIATFDTDGDGFIDITFAFGANGLADLLETAPESGAINYAHVNSDSDSNLNFQDIDADNDGIPDNIELQSTLTYIAPDATVTEFGINTAYVGGMTLTYSDLDPTPDYLDTDADEDGFLDIEENGMINTINNLDTDGDGLDDAFEGSKINDPYDVNDDIDDPALSILPDNNNNLGSGGDLDYRDAVAAFPPNSALIDFDGVDDYTEMSPSVLNGLSEFTWMFWMKYEGTPFDNSDKVFVMGQDDVFEVTIEKNVDGDNTKQSINGRVFVQGGANQQTSLDFDPANWTHISISAKWDGTNTSFDVYRNGYSAGTQIVPVQINSNGNTFRMGDLAGFDLFTGWIDEFRIFDLALTQDQVRRMIYQEIEDNSGNIRGTEIPKDIIDGTTNATIPWANLVTYYTMSSVQTGLPSFLLDDSSYSNHSTLNNITSFLESTAPIPFETINANKTGNWNTPGLWKHEDVWDIEDLDASVNFISDQSPAPWTIIRIHDNITIDQYTTGLGMIIDENRTLTVTADNELENNWYLELNGTIDLIGDSQLVQTDISDLAVSSFGKIKRRQQGAASNYWYNYWSSPVGQLSVTQNNTPFSLAILKDSNESNLNFTTSYDASETTPATISERWLFTFTNGVTFWDWDVLDTDTFIVPGTGYTQKGSGTSLIAQEYLFEGKPNNGTILLSAIDTGGPGNEQDVSLTNYLLGNPYPSALDSHQFIDDNVGVIDGTLKLWEQWAGTSHILQEYQGGYGFINKLTSERAYQYPGIPVADNNGDGDVTAEDAEGIKTPTRYIPVSQAFFVEITNDGNIEFNNTQRIFKQETLGESVFMRNSQGVSSRNEDSPLVNDDFQKIRLEFATSAGATRRFTLGFSENTSDGYDYGYDGGRIEVAPNEDMGSLFEDRQYVIQAFAPITLDKEIDLYFKSSGNLTYSLDIAELVNIDPSQDIYLRDTRENIYWDLRQGPYNFSAFAGVDKDRFDIVFKPGPTLSVGDTTIEGALIYADNELDKLYIKGLTEDINKLTITNLLGQTVKSYSDIEHQKASDGITINYLSSGIYIINIETDTKQQGKKVIIY